MECREVDVEQEIVIGTWNLWEYGMYPDRSGERDRYDMIAQVMADHHAHIWTVQEVGSEAALVELAEKLGLCCREGDSVVYDPGGHGFGVGVLWDPAVGIAPVPGSVRSHTRDVFFHGVAEVALDLGDDRLLHVASGHATPWGAPQNISEAKRWVSIMTRPNRRIAALADVVLPGVLGTDSNGVTGDRIRRPDGTWDYHAPDPVEGKPWIADMVYQVPQPYVLDTETGLPIPRADRAAGEILYAGGLADSTAVLGLPVIPTTGYHHVDPYGDRDLDHLRVVGGIRSALLDVTVIDSAEVRQSSDHRVKQLRVHRDSIPKTVLTPAQGSA